MVVLLEDFALRAKLTLQMVAFDTQWIQSGATSATFFCENEGDEAESAATMPEPLLVRWLASDFRVRDLLLFRTWALKGRMAGY